VRRRCRRSAAVLDVDGVPADGRLRYGPEGEIDKVFRA
jgi:3-deoxy-D-manno-octulosonate 8-phosphate phosphatase KdsC-like HAD superfamily phosphatase